MKRYILFVLLIVLAINLFGCKTADSSTLAEPDTVVESTPLEKEEESQGAVSAESKGFEPIEYELNELLELKKKNPETADIREFPQDYEEFLKRLEETEYSIVAGRAYGTRSATPYIMTNFLVEKVYAGIEVPQKITIRESLILKYNADKTPYLQCRGYARAPLSDDPVLLAIRPRAEEKGVYQIKLIAIPLTEDYQQYDEEYLTEFLDFFRGKRSAYRYPDQVETEIVVDGYPMIFAQGGNRWPEQNADNEEMLEQLKDNILVQLVKNYKIKLWPSGHINYPEGRSGYAYFSKMSSPIDEVR
ncbi:MAG: hypothetical protein IKM48_07020 [Clostridia bacterium]|nr:hypothetical protein [Clostridia bacterium]